MINRTPFARFIPGGSPLHLIDPRVKLAGAAVVITSGLLAGRWTGLFAIAMAVVATALAARASWRDAARDVWALRYLYVVTIVLHSILSRGEPLLRLPAGVVISGEGILRGCFFSVKIALLAVLIGLLLRTTHPASLVAALESLPVLGGKSGAPGRLALTLGLAVRFLPTIFTEAERIRWAQIGRGLDVTGGPVRRARSLAPLLLPLVASSLDRVDTITTAMQARGYRLDAPRTRYRPLKLQIRDGAAGLVIVLAVVLALV